MIISYSIMMHPKRRMFTDYLLSNLGEAQIAMDRGKGIWDTCKRAWLLHVNSDIHFVIQDDAIFCKDFKSKVERLVNKRGIDYFYCLYYANRRKYQQDAINAYKRGIDHVVLKQLRWGIALGAKVSLINGMIKYCDKIKLNSDDIRIRRWLYKRGISVYYPIPSLIDHRAGIPSLVGRGTGRHALYFEG